MNEAHYHLVVNHFPIIGTIFGFGILIAGIFIKNNPVKNVAYSIFILSAAFALLSLKTGGPAAGVVKDMPGITKEIIHEHAESAHNLAYALYALAIISLIGIYMNIKHHSKAKLVSFLALAVAAIGIFLAQKVGTTGGEVRHTEIREGYKTSNTESAEDDGNDDD